MKLCHIRFRKVGHHVEPRLMSDKAASMRAIGWFLVEVAEGRQTNPLTEFDRNAAKGLSPCVMQTQGDDTCGRNYFEIQASSWLFFSSIVT
jgi:hypothetical protein